MTDTSFFNQRIKEFLVICAIILIPSTPSLSQTLKNQCPAGKFCPAGTISPVDCPAGHYCPTGSNEPRECGGGKTCSTKNMTAAQNCTAGSYCPSIPTIQCPEGHYCPAGSASPIVCPPQTWAKAGQTECRAASSYAASEFTYVTHVWNDNWSKGELQPGVYAIGLKGGSGGNGSITRGGNGGVVVFNFVLRERHEYFMVSGANGGSSMGVPIVGPSDCKASQSGSGGGGGSWVALWPGMANQFYPQSASNKFIVAGGGAGTPHDGCQYPGGTGGGIGAGGGGGRNSGADLSSGRGGNSGSVLGYVGGDGSNASNNWFGQGGKGVTNGHASKQSYNGSGGGCGGSDSSTGLIGSACTGYTLFEGYNFTGPFGGGNNWNNAQQGKSSHPTNQPGAPNLQNSGDCRDGCAFLWRLR